MKKFLIYLPIIAFAFSAVALFVSPDLFIKNDIQKIIYIIIGSLSILTYLILELWTYTRN